MSKAAFSAAKAAVQAQNWDEVRKQTVIVLAKDSEHYNANVFLALALAKLSEVNDSEVSYRRAININRENPLAWQGLVKLYEDTWQAEGYMDASMSLAEILMNKDDRVQCDTVVQRILPFVEKHGNKAQVKQAYENILPGSPIYDYLEGLLPHPALTYQKIAEVYESEERETINKEIATRRSRLGATVQSVTAEVKLEIYKKSPLERIYDNIINWSLEDTVRREYEAKQIRRGHDLLIVLPPAEKDEQRQKLLKWCEGIVILKAPFELAWTIWIEWKNYESIGDLDKDVLINYIDLFPNSGLAYILRGYMASDISPFTPVELAERDDDDGGVSLNPEHYADDRLDFMIDGLEKANRSILGHRIMGNYYLHLKEYEQAAEVFRKARVLLDQESARSGIDFQVNMDAITIGLGTALVQYQAPKHHPEATSLFNAILKRNPTSSGSLLGLGEILQVSGDYTGAASFLNQALSRDPENVKILSEIAWCEVMQGHYDLGRGQLEQCVPMITKTDPASQEMRAQIFWRIGYAIWESDPSPEARGDRSQSYHYFMQALKHNGNFAPAFTSLGIFYADILHDTDRANKCFHKAFEISAGEFDAAERLARSFAGVREWELVEIVARRAAEAEKKRTTPGKGTAWPQVALGIVELNNQNYPLAIQAFQAALRISPTDFHSWVGLGEAYTSSGRFTAATKAFNQAHLLNDTNWFSTFLLANVQQELGEFDKASAGYRKVLETQPTEFGVLMALTDTLISDSMACVQKGLYGRAAEGAIEALQTAQKIVSARPDAFNLWKAVGDACLTFTSIQSLLPQFPSSLVTEILSTQIDKAELNILADVDAVGSHTLAALELTESTSLQTVLQCAILSYKRGIYASAEEKHAHAVAWFNLGTAEFRAFVSGGEGDERENKYRLCAVRSFKRSIKLEPGNPEFWNALGVATSDISPRIAQHALIRALYMDEKNTRTWTNLGALYLLQLDIELANQAFSKAQSTDPEFAHAWVGQGLVAMLEGQTEDAQELFEHAFQIAESFSPIVKRSYATTSFDMIAGRNSSEALSAPIFALVKLAQQLSPAITTPLRLSALYNERFGAFTTAINSLMSVSATLESRYEASEADGDLRQYAESQCDLARAHLGDSNYSLAIEHATTALDLSEALDNIKECRLSAHLTAGLGYYFEGKMEESLEMFTTALEESNEDPDIVCLLAQVLWAKGGEEEKDAVRESLLGCIEKHPDHLQSTMLLAVIGTLDSDADITESALDEIRAVRATDKLTKEQRSKIDELLGTVASLTEAHAASVTEAIFLRPAAASTWAALADSTEATFAADMALNLAKDGSVPAEELSRCYARIGSTEDDLMAVWLAPWREAGWRGLNVDLVM